MGSFCVLTMSRHWACHDESYQFRLDSTLLENRSKNLIPPAKHDFILKCTNPNCLQEAPLFFWVQFILIANDITEGTFVEVFVIIWLLLQNNAISRQECWKPKMHTTIHTHVYIHAHKHAHIHMPMYTHKCAQNSTKTHVNTSSATVGISTTKMILEGAHMHNH